MHVHNNDTRIQTFLCTATPQMKNYSELNHMLGTNLPMVSDEFSPCA